MERAWVFKDSCFQSVPSGSRRISVLEMRIKTLFLFPKGHKLVFDGGKWIVDLNWFRRILLHYRGNTASTNIKAFYPD